MTTALPVAVHLWLADGENWAWHRAFGTDVAATHALAVALDGQLRRPRPAAAEPFTAPFAGRGTLVGVRAPDPVSANPAAFRGGPPTILRVALVPAGFRSVGDLGPALAAMRPDATGPGEWSIPAELEPVEVPPTPAAPNPRRRWWPAGVAAVVAVVVGLPLEEQPAPAVAPATPAAPAPVAVRVEPPPVVVILPPTAPPPDLSDADREALADAVVAWGYARPADGHEWESFARAVSADAFAACRTADSRHPFAVFVDRWARNGLPAGPTPAAALRGWLDAPSETTVPDLVAQARDALRRWPDPADCHGGDPVEIETVTRAERFLKAPPGVVSAARPLHDWLRGPSSTEPFDPRRSYSTLARFVRAADARVGGRAGLPACPPTEGELCAALNRFSGVSAANPAAAVAAAVAVIDRPPPRSRNSLFNLRGGR
ncbi:MAG TPA: hypothetical protein VD866_25425 [Urbifossiella sp.]|nr:hypothetical protein [Urbifossiella sp.]